MGKYETITERGKTVHRGNSPQKRGASSILGVRNFFAFTLGFQRQRAPGPPLKQSVLRLAPTGGKRINK
jgi:hypothetical protein